LDDKSAGSLLHEGGVSRAEITFGDNAIDNEFCR